MKDRTILVSAVIACLTHAVILFINLGMSPPTLASAASSIEVTLVAAPAAPASEPASVAAPSPEPEQVEPPQEAIPEAIIEPLPEPEPIEEAEPMAEPESKPVPTVEPTPIMEPELIPEIEPAGSVASADEDESPQTEVVEERQVSAEISEEDTAGPPSIDSVGDAVESGGRTIADHPALDRLPAYTYNPKPKYPRAARRRGQQGTVVLLVEVLADGSVGEVEIEEPAGYELLDNAAAEAVRRWRFVPASKGGRTVSAWVRIPVEFSLKGKR